jgi:hypothetical protein
MRACPTSGILPYGKIHEQAPGAHQYPGARKRKSRVNRILVRIRKSRRCGAREGAAAFSAGCLPRVMLAQCETCFGAASVGE